MKTLVIAFGGNAISPPDKKESEMQRMQRLERVVGQLRGLVKRGSKTRLMFTHGNGADIGNLLLCQEALRDRFPLLSLETLGAMTQGELGFWLQQTVTNQLRKEVACVVTRVLVSASDPSLRKKTKPIGPYYQKKIFQNMVFVKGKGYRRVVASPKPLKILEASVIRKLFNDGVLVIAGGGGGIPVVRQRALRKGKRRDRKKGRKIIGVEGVIDKDLCAAKLAELVRADTLLILTNVDGVYIHYGAKNEKKFGHLTSKEAFKFLKAGEFGEGSMKPKIKAALQFLKAGGKRCYIGPWEQPLEILKGKTGTEIV